MSDYGKLKNESITYKNEQQQIAFTSNPEAVTFWRNRASVDQAKYLVMVEKNSLLEQKEMNIRKEYISERDYNETLKDKLNDKENLIKSQDKLIKKYKNKLTKLKYKNVENELNNKEISNESITTIQSLKYLYKCKFDSNNDTNGLLYYIGTRGNTTSWKNPCTRKMVSTSASSIRPGTVSSRALCGRYAVRCSTQSLRNSWMKINLKGFYIIPTYYSLRHYINGSKEAARNWILEASFDGKSWRTISKHSNDKSLKKAGQVHTWALDGQGEMFSAFRIRQTGKNSSANHRLACSGFEIYGDVYHAKMTNAQEVKSDDGKTAKKSQQISLKFKANYDNNMSNSHVNDELKEYNFTEVPTDKLKESLDSILNQRHQLKLEMDKHEKNLSKMSK